MLVTKQQWVSPWPVHNAGSHWFRRRGQTPRAPDTGCWWLCSPGWRCLLQWTGRGVHCHLHPRSGSGSWPVERSRRAARPLQSHSSSVSQRRPRSTASPGRSCDWWWRSPRCWPPPSPKARRLSCTQAWTAAARITWCWDPGWGPGPCAGCRYARFPAAPPLPCSPFPGPGIARPRRWARPPAHEPDLPSPYSSLDGTIYFCRSKLPRERRWREEKSKGVSTHRPSSSAALHNISSDGRFSTWPNRFK